MKETLHWNHYKTYPRLKDTLIFFLTGGFYKTYETDAIIVAQLFGFKITTQDGLQTIGFLEKSTTYFDRLEDAGYSYFALKIEDDGNISTLRKFEGDKTLELTVPLENFQGLLNDLLRIYERYTTSLRLIQPIDIPFNIEKEDKYKVKELLLPNSADNERIVNKEKSQKSQNQLL